MSDDEAHGEEAGDVAARLRSIMKERDWTIAEFAEHARISRSAIEKYIAGTQFPRFEALRSICEGCNVSADWLVLGRASPVGVSAPMLRYVAQPIIEKTLVDFLSGADELERQRIKDGREKLVYEVSIVSAHRIAERYLHLLRHPNEPRIEGDL